MPENANQLELEIYCFANTPNQQNVAKVNAENDGTYVISEKTDFQMSIDL